MAGEDLFRSTEKLDWEFPVRMEFFPSPEGKIHSSGFPKNPRLPRKGGNPSPGKGGCPAVGFIGWASR